MIVEEETARTANSMTSLPSKKSRSNRQKKITLNIGPWIRPLPWALKLPRGCHISFHTMLINPSEEGSPNVRRYFFLLKEIPLKGI
jgi:hypothetical protein